MAKLFLDSTDTSYKVSNGNTEIFGANGNQAITIDGNLTGIALDANVERVAFTGATTDYTYKQVGTDLEVYNSTGALVTKIGVIDDATVKTQLTFANGTVDAKIVPVTGAAPVLSVGGQTVSVTAPAAVTIPAANIDVTTYPITSPTFSVASVAATATEGSNAVFTVTLANPATTATTVQYTLSNVDTTTSADYGTATAAGTNVTDASGVLTFAAGATTATVTLPVSLDSLTETTEGVSLTLSNPTGGAIVNDAGKVATVSFVDAPATTFTLTSTGTGVEVQEGSTITFTVTPSSVVTADTTLVLNVQGKALGAVTSTASAADFEATPALTFVLGDTAAKTITMKVATDAAVEGREAYSVDIVDTVKYESKGNQVTGVITDKLPLLSLSQNVATVNEGSSVTYTVTSDEAAPAGGITVPLVFTGTATSGTDYTALTANSITIPVGSKTGSVTLTTTADTLTDGADETVIVTLGTSANASIDATKNTVTTTISDTSKALGTAEMTLAGATSVDEGSTVTYTVTLGSNATTALSIPYTLSGTATSGTDFTGSTGTISVPVGSNKGTLTLSTTADLATEGAETVTVTLGAVTGFTAVTNQGAVTTTINDTSLATAGGSFVLTTAADIYNGTAGDDTVSGSLVYDSSEAVTTAATFSVADQLNGGAGTDRLDISVSGAQDGAVTFPVASISGVESFYIRNTIAQNLSIDASNFSGLTTLNSDRSGGKIVVTNLATGAAIGVVGNASVVNGDVDFAYATGTAPVTIAISGGVKAGTLTNTGTTSTTATVNVTGSVANNVTSIDLDSAQDISSLTINASAGLTVALANDYSSTSSLVVSGAASTPYTGSFAAVSLGSLGNFKTINASGMTAGGVSIAGGSNLTSFIGGVGTDVFTAASSYAATTAGMIDAGAGTDTLVVNNSTLVDTAGEAAYYSNFETFATTDRAVGTNTTADSYNLALLSGITSLKLGAMDNAADDQTLSGLTATQAGAVTVTGDNVNNDLTLALATSSGSSDTLNLNLKSDTATSNVDVSLLTINGFENLIVDATTGTVGTSSDLAFKASGADVLTSVTLKGSAAIGFSGTNTTKALTVDGSTMTGTATISGNFVNNSTVTTGSGADSITLGTGYGTYNANNGDDAFAAATVAQLNSGSSYNKLDGGAGTDTLTITGAQAITMVDDNFKYITNIEKIVQSSTGANALSVTTGGWFDAGFKATGVNYTATVGDQASSILMSSFTGNATISLTTAATTGYSATVQTGSGNDVVSVLSATPASGFVGASGKVITVSTGAGNDTVTVTTDNDTAVDIANVFAVTAGTGADAITVTTHVNGSSSGAPGYGQFVVAAGDSPKTGYDSITGFNLGGASTQSDNLEFPGTASIASNVSSQSIAGYTTGELTYSIATGVLTFSGTKASTLSAADAINAVDVAITTDTATVVFVNGSDSYVYNTSTSGDSVVKLVGVNTADALITTNNDGPNDLFIS